MLMVPRPWSPGRLSTSTTQAVSTHQNPPQMSNPSPSESVLRPIPRRWSPACPPPSRVPPGLPDGLSSHKRVWPDAYLQGCCPRVPGVQPGPPAESGMGPWCHRVCKPFPRVLGSRWQPHDAYELRSTGWGPGTGHMAAACLPTLGRPHRSCLTQAGPCPQHPPLPAACVLPTTCSGGKTLPLSDASLLPPGQQPQPRGQKSLFSEAVPSGL